MILMIRRYAIACACASLIAVTTIMAGSMAGALQAQAAKYKSVHLNIGVSSGFFTSGAIFGLAQKQGFFKRYGIVPTFVPVSVAAIPEALASGAIDTTVLAASTAVTMRNAGGNVRIIGAQSSTCPYDFVASTKETAIPIVKKGGATWQQAIKWMVGKTIAYGGARGIGSGAYVDSYFKSVNLNPAQSYNFLSLPTGSPTVAAFTAGTVNVALVQPQTATQLVKLGLGKIMLQVSQSGPPLARNSAFTGYLMMEPFLQAHPGIATRFVDAMSDAFAWAKEPKNLDNVVVQALNDEDLDPNPYDSASIEALLSSSFPSTQFTQQQAQNLFTLLKQIGSLPQTATIKTSDVFTASSIVNSH
jgi:ABC-type nitrate/sulfonate/bicarbonate transport system substrate-binding protein